MRLISVHSDASGESFELMPSQMIPYNLGTLFNLTQVSVLCQPENTTAQLCDNCFVVPEETTVCRVAGQPPVMSADKAQARQKQQMMAGAKLRLVKNLKDAQDEAKKAETQANPRSTPPPQRATPPAVPQPGVERKPEPTHPLPAAAVPPVATAAIDPIAPIETAKTPAVEGTFLCRYCRHEIPLQNQMLHEANCKRHKVPCPECGSYFSESALQDHVDEEHTKYQCQFCSKSFGKKELIQHEEGCTEKPAQCPHCERAIPMSLLSFHESTCEFKTVRCEKCGTYVGMNKMDAHKRECAGWRQYSGATTRGPRDLAAEVEKLFQGGSSGVPTTVGGTMEGSQDTPINVDDPMDDEAFARALQEKEYQQGPAPADVPRAETEDIASPDTATERLIAQLQREQQEQDERLARELGGEGPTSRTDPVPPAGRQEGYAGTASVLDDPDEATRQLLDRMRQEQEEEDSRVAREFSRGDRGGYSSGRGRGRGYGAEDFSHPRHPAPSTSFPAPGLPRRAREAPASEETDEEMAIRLAREEYGED